MEIFISTICTVNVYVTTCQYGGVLLYSLILLILLAIFAVSFLGTYYLIKKVL